MFGFQPTKVYGHPSIADWPVTDNSRFLAHSSSFVFSFWSALEDSPAWARCSVQLQRVPAAGDTEVQTKGGQGGVLRAMNTLCTKFVQDNTQVS